MRIKVFIFLAIAFSFLTFIPAINIFINIDRVNDSKWWSRSFLYNFDFVRPYLSRIFYPLGITINPGQVVIGKNQWLYLGDDHQESISVPRRGVTENDKEVTLRIDQAIQSWQEWFSHQGVRAYKIILGPNKNSIYPEYLPTWAQPAGYSRADYLLSHAGKGVYIDTRPALLAEKNQSSAPLYFKTDTHWNEHGALVAFHALVEDLSKTEKDLHWLNGNQLSITVNEQVPSGDLARFLYMSDVLKDTDVIAHIKTSNPINVDQYDFETGNLIGSGGNPIFLAPRTPMLVRSKHALNNKRVLWLRDSFGERMAPLMAATFTETLQFHYALTDPKMVAHFVEAYKPDYVFITVVERAAFTEWFEKLPPQEDLAP